MATARVLLVDDDEIIRYSLTKILEDQGFEITSAASVPEALQNISSEQYDVLLSDLHMPGPGDGLTVVSAMRHANPRAVTLLLSSYPDLERATEAILLQADEILVKPVNAETLLEVIEQRLRGGPSPVRIVESVGTILQREIESTIGGWFKAVERSESLMAIAMTFEARSAYLWLILSDLSDRLKSPVPLGSSRPPSLASREHGADRYRNGYTIVMIVEESRFLQVSIFQVLQSNLARVDFSVILSDVMIIADEIDFQLGEMMIGYTAASAAVHPTPALTA